MAGRRQHLLVLTHYDGRVHEAHEFRVSDEMKTYANALLRNGGLRATTFDLVPARTEYRETDTWTSDELGGRL